MEEMLLNRIGELVRKEDKLDDCLKALIWFVQKCDKTEMGDRIGMELLCVEAHDKFEAILAGMDEGWLE